MYGYSSDIQIGIHIQQPEEQLKLDNQNYPNLHVIVKGIC